MTTSMTQNNPTFSIEMTSYIIIKGLALNMNFQTKKSICLYIEQWSNGGGATLSNLPSEKNAKQFFETVFFIF